MTDFHEILFPVDISYGSKGGPQWKTSVWAADSGFEARVADWSTTRSQFDVSMGIQTQAQMDALTSFFYNRRGRAYGFRFKDWNDYQVSDIILGYGDYVASSYQVKKTYSSPGHDGTEYNVTRTIKKLAWGTEQGVKIDDVSVPYDAGIGQYYNINYNEGVITLSQPLWGVFYHGTAPSSVIDLITTGEGGTSTDFFRPTNVNGGTMYDAALGWAYLLGQFPGSEKGVRRINAPTAAEVLQLTADDMNLPPLGNSPYTTNGIGGLICAGNGFLYLSIGGGTNTQAIAKVDGETLQYVDHWGTVAGGIPGDDDGSLPSVCGALSLDGDTFVFFSQFGSIYLHSAETCARLSTILDTGGLTSHGHVGACPFGESGFAIAYNNSGSLDGNCALHIVPGAGATSYPALFWGTETSEVRAALYDQKTGGVLLFWENEEGENATDDFWCGLYHPDLEGFMWRRKMPRNLMYLNVGGLDMQTPLNGTMCWSNTTSIFGWCVWILDTETGELRARRSPTNSSVWQAYDPGRQYIIATGNATNRVISTDVTGIDFDPAEVVTLDYVEFHVGVRFDTDHLNAKHEFWNTQSWESIPLIEVRNWSDVDVD